MRQKFIYIAFVLATIFLLIFINRKSNINQHVPEEKASQEFSVEQQGLLTKRLQPSLSSPAKPRITIIKKAKPVEESLLPESRTNTSVPPKKEPYASSSTSSSGNQNTQSAVEKPAAGVTKLGKRPSPQQTNELNEQGIIMY